jgi:nicotinic acid mononucleotide adenylyltransferase
MWLDGFQWEKAHVRLSEWRVREAMKASGQRETFLPPGMPKTRKRRKKASKETRQRVLVTACPYEPPRFEDAVKTIDEASDLIVKDIAELLAQSMGLEG